MKRNFEKNLKKFLKRKIKITLGLIVAFLITGAVGYSEKINETVWIESEDGKIVISPDTAGKLEGNTIIVTVHSILY